MKFLTLFCRTSHIDLCLTIGRGQAIYKADRNQSILNDTGLRLKVYEAIATFSSQSEHENITPTPKWPLCLCSSHHALVLSNLTSEAIPANSSEASPEIFISNSIMASILSAFQIFLSKQDDLPFIFRERNENHESKIADEDIPLSYRDSLLFITVVGRLPTKNRKQFVSNFIDELYSIVQDGNIEIGKIASLNYEVSSFLARVITIISCLIDIVGIGMPLIAKYNKVAGPTNYSPPSLPGIVKSAEAEENIHDDCNWYVRERCFLGLTLDWESPSVPMEKEPQITERMSSDCISKAMKIVSIAFDIGFLSAKNDHCHLLYASWNAAIKVNAWDPKTVWRGPITGKICDNASDAESILSLREDMCGIHRLLNKSISNDHVGTVLHWLLTSKEQNKDIENSHEIILKDGLMNAVSMLKLVAKKASLHSKSKVLSTKKIALIESLVIFISFLVSYHTMQEDDYVTIYNREKKSKSIQRQSVRKNSGNSGESMDDDGILDEETGNIMSDESGESDAGYPDFDDDDEEEAKLDALGALHDACYAIGGAPTHPDWLDTHCHLREGIDIITAMRSGEAALNVLTDLSSIAYSHLISALKRALILSIPSSNLSRSDDDIIGNNADLALNLLSCNFGEECNDFTSNDFDSTNSDDSLVDAVASFCEFPKGAVQRCMIDMSFDKIQNVREAWCPNSAHCIRGSHHDSNLEGWEVSPGEQRATGEWELLLADVFLVSVIDNHGIDGEKVISDDCSKNIDDHDNIEMTLEKENSMQSSNIEFIKVQQWARILYSATSCMVSACALLRFGVNNGQGRIQHPLSKRGRISSDPLLVITPFDDMLLNNSKASLIENDLKKKINFTVSNALILFSRIASDGIIPTSIHKACQAATTHLVTDPSTIVNLVALQRLRKCKSAFSSIISTKDEHCTQQVESSGKLFNNLLRCIENFSDMIFIKRSTTFSAASSLRQNENKRVIQAVDDSQQVARLRFRTLLSHLGCSDLLSVENIVESSGNCCKHLIAGISCSDSNEKYTLISIFLKLLTHSKWSLDALSRLKITSLLEGLISAEREASKMGNSKMNTKTPISSLMLKSWNNLESNDVVVLIRKDLCMLDMSTHDLCMSRNLKSIILHMLSSLASDGFNCDNEDVTGFQLILCTLLDSLEEWAGDHTESHEHVMELLCVLATRFNELKQTGTRLLSLVTSTDNVETVKICYRLSSLELFYRFIRDSIEKLEEVKAQSENKALSTPHLDTQISTSFDKKSEISSKSRALSSLDDMLARKVLKKNDKSLFLTKSGQKIRRTCSYVETGGEFTEQHWYICYTCNLLWDKGCCSLCAQVCHRGHDVGYSRRSSFFCDCGAEMSESSNHDAKVSCRCLKQISSNELNLIYNQGKAEVEQKIRPDRSLAKSFSTIGTSSDLLRVSSKSIFSNEIVMNAIYSSPAITESVVSDFVEVLRVTGWTQSLFAQFERYFEEWKTKKKSRLFYDHFFNLPPLSKVSSLTMGNTQRKESHTSTQHCIRDGKSLKLETITKDTMFKIRATKPNAVNMRLSLDASSSHKRKTHRCAIVSDNRGRVIIAEPYSLVFISAASVTNTRHVVKPLETPIKRSQLCVLGTAKVKMNAVGMQLCPTNNRHLVVWGMSEACVVVLNKFCDAAEAVINLAIELEPHECDTEYLIKCEWIPGSETLVLAICGTFLKVFDIRRSNGMGSDKNISCRSTTCYTMGYEDVLIRSATMIGGYFNKYLIENIKQTLIRDKNSDKKNNHLVDGDEEKFTSSIIYGSKEYAVQLIILMDTGRLSVTELRIDANGDLEDQGESYIECGDGLRFPIGGVRRHLGASPCIQGSTSNSLGQGSTLHYLRQSNLLLYKCVSSPLIAMQLDKAGNIVGSFELLPHVITSEIIGSSSDGQSISAPYCHWTELGTTYYNDELVFRVTCVGSSSKTSQPRLLYIEFSETRVQVKELLSESNSSMTIDGLATYYAPFELGRKFDDSSNSIPSSFEERLYLAAVQSNGSVVFFGEGNYQQLKEKTKVDINNNQNLVQMFGSYQSDECLSSKNMLDFDCTDDFDMERYPSFPLTIFEDLINISSYDDLVFGGDFTLNEPNSAAVKEKLKINNVDFMSCSSRQGCTLALSLRKNEKNNDKAKRNNKQDSLGSSESSGHYLSSIVIVAVRILIGSSTTEYLPQQMYVMGRSIKLIEGAKRWYDVPLTNEEIYLGVRTGNVTIGIVGSNDSSNCPIIDAVEVYGKQRADLNFLQQISLPYDAIIDEKYYFDTNRNIKRSIDQESNFDGRERDSPDEALISSVLCLTHICRILKEKVDSSHINLEIVQSLIQMTALVSGKGGLREYVMDFLREIEPEDSVRQLLTDKGTLLGIADELINLRNMCLHLFSDASEQTVIEKGKDDDSTSNMPSKNKHKSRHARPFALKHLIKCLKATLIIANERPKNYVKVMQEIVSEGRLHNFIAIEAKVVYDTLLEGEKPSAMPIKNWLMDCASLQIAPNLSININLSGYNEAASHITRLVLFEMAIAGQKNIEGVPANEFVCSYASFNTISDLLKSQHSKIVQCCCTTIASVFDEIISLPCDTDTINSPTSSVLGLGNINFLESKTKIPDEVNPLSKGPPPPIAYQCDSCGLFPITSIRYTLEGEDIDLCKKCFESGCSHARSVGKDEKVAVKINGIGLKLHGNDTLSCAQMNQMRSVPVESVIVEQVRIAELTKSSTSNISIKNTVANSYEASKSRTVNEQPNSNLDTVSKTEARTMDNQYSSLKDINNKYHLKPLSEFLRGCSFFDSLLGEFVSILFYMLEPKGNELASRSKFIGCFTGVNHLLQLILYLILKANSYESRLHRGKRFTETMVINLSQLVNKYLNNGFDDELSHHARISMIIVLKALVSLRLQKESTTSAITGVSEEADLDSTMNQSKSKDKTNPKYFCDVHGVPAVRRRCSHGIHKDRRFYLCGKERSDRCKYFRWANDNDDKSLTSNASSRIPTSQKMGPCDAIQTELWNCFSRSGPNDSAPLQSQICSLLQTIYNNYSDDNSRRFGEKDNFNSQLSNEEQKSSIGRAAQTHSYQLQSLNTENTIIQDWLDGVMISRCKNRSLLDDNDTGDSSQKCTEPDLGMTIEDTNHLLVEASLDLLSHFATNSLEFVSTQSSKISPTWSSGWFSLLCEILSSSSQELAHQRLQAKNMLKKLCGGRKEIYHRVRDHYVFAFQFKKLLCFCENVLSSAIEVKEKARQCGPNWNEKVDFSWKSLSPGGLLGVEGLISEDSLTIQNEEKIRIVLEELIDVTKNRGGNWRQFCAMNELPISDGSQEKTVIYSRPPIFSLFWMACSLSGSNQIKILRLIEVALTPSAEATTIASKKKSEKDIHLFHHDVTTSVRISNSYPFLNSCIESKGDRGTPEHVLLNQENNFTLVDIYTFVIQFVLRGKTSQLRSASSKVVEKIFQKISASNMNTFLTKLMSEPLYEVGSLGYACAEYFKLIQNLIISSKSKSAINFDEIAVLSVECFVRQMQALSRDFYDRCFQDDNALNHRDTDSLKFFDLRSCVHCHRYRHGAPESTVEQSNSSIAVFDSSLRTGSGAKASCKSANTVSSLLSEDKSKRSSTNDKRSSKQKNNTLWLPEQVRPYNKYRLDFSSDRVVSTEFATHIQLKNRQAVLDVHVTISDPRGRLVKTINVFFSPRQVENASQLKNKEYISTWQQCGTIKLARGSLRASCSLSPPAIAANLKFEYKEFYEKVGSTRSSDGGILLTCPRCTRVVNNAHGVCGHCGEVAYQCRKCRHINYDRLDAFLCVECGYCASGGFVYELTAGNASNAVAILDEQGYERSLKLMNIASRKLGETRHNLRVKILALNVANRKRCYPGDVEDIDKLSKFGPSLKRALLGEMPKLNSKSDTGSSNDSTNRRRSAASIVASRRGRQNSAMSAANKARSILNLARQLRNGSIESEIDLDRSGRGDNLVRQALMNVSGTSGSLGFFDDSCVFGDDGDVFGIINGSQSGTISQGDIPHPLSRLVANIQARVRSSTMANIVGGSDETTNEVRSSDSDGGGEAGNGKSVSSGSQKSSHVQIEDCKRLHLNMREFEREYHELQKNIDAWNDLNTGQLVESKSVFIQKSSVLPFVPTFCSSCSDSVALTLLVLIMRICEVKRDNFEFPVNKKFIQALLNEPWGMRTDLKKLKRLAIVRFVTKSNKAAHIVLNQLEKRLKATNDVMSAEILGAILEHEFDISDEYATLAMEVLSEVD